jgi:myo-inositol-1(or 4)-monophosphatase
MKETNPVPEFEAILFDACKAASKVLLEFYNPVSFMIGPRRTRRLGVIDKDPRDPRTIVTAADIASEKTLVYSISRKADCSFLSEECGTLASKHGSEFRVIIDSLDGTKNFIQGSNGLFGINVGVERNGEPFAGAIALPYFDEILIAQVGRGVVLRRMRKTGAPQSLEKVVRTHSVPLPLKKARVYIGRGAGKLGVLARPPLTNLFRTVNEGISYASSAIGIAAVALRRIDGLVLPGQKHWDIAGGLSILKELGGYYALWRGGWKSEIGHADLAKSTPDSMFDIAMAVDRELFLEITARIRSDRRK